MIDRRRHAERPALAEPDDLRRQAIDRDAVAQHQREAARDAEHAERDDEGRDRALGDEKAVDRAGERAHREAADDPDPPRQVEVRGQHRADDAREREDRADRQVDAGRADDEGHADRQHAEHRGRQQDVEDVARRRGKRSTAPPSPRRARRGRSAIRGGPPRRRRCAARQDGEAAWVVVEAIGETSPSVARPRRRRASAGRRRRKPYFTYCSIGSLLASMTSLVSTSVGT